MDDVFFQTIFILWLLQFIQYFVNIIKTSNLILKNYGKRLILLKKTIIMALLSVLENSESLTLAHSCDVIKMPSHDVMDLNNFYFEW